MLDPQLRGLFASIGIQKGKPFAPDERMKGILSKAAEVGNATARTMLWYERDKSAFLYESSNWKRGFVGGSYEFLKDEGAGGRNLDARAQFFYFATVNTPALWNSSSYLTQTISNAKKNIVTLTVVRKDMASR